MCVIYQELPVRLINSTILLKYQLQAATTCTQASCPKAFSSAHVHMQATRIYILNKRTSEQVGSQARSGLDSSIKVYSKFFAEIQGAGCTKNSGSKIPN